LITLAKGKEMAHPERMHPAVASVDVAIVGAGMVGLTLASALARAGVSVAVVDRAPAVVFADAARDGRASALALASVRVLESIGLWRAMEREAEPIREIRVSDGEARLFLHYDHRDLGAEPLGYIVENSVTRKALATHAAAANLPVLAGRRVVAMSAGPASAELSLDDGTIVRATLVAAADGRGSSLRNLAGIGATEWRYPQTGIVCTVAHARPHRGIAHERFLPPGPFAILPMTGNRSSIVWTEAAALAPALLALDDAEFAAELARRFGDHLGPVEVAGPRFSYPLLLVHAERYIAPRLALVGDAAHAIHPIAGQGLNIGLRDVAALAEVVVDAKRLGLDFGSTAVLARYERWRRFDNLAMLAVTDGLNRLFSNDLAPLRVARDLGLAAVDRLPALKRVFMRHAMGTLGELPRLMRGEAP
jgi:2-octaprenyl-6-methoxyphenol hydroxylase